MPLDIKTADIETWEDRKFRCRFLMDTWKTVTTHYLTVLLDSILIDVISV